MEKEKILEASRKENKKKDFAEIEEENKAVKIAAIAIILLATVYFCLNIFIKGETNYGIYSIIALYNAIVFGYKGIRTKKKISIVNGVIWTLLTIMLTYAYISKIIATSTIM